MQASTAATLTIGDYGTIFVAIELSQKTWLVTLHSPDKDKISRHKLEGGQSCRAVGVDRPGTGAGGAGAGGRSGSGELLRGRL